MKLQYRILLFLILFVSGSQHAYSQNNWDADNPLGNFSYCSNWYSDACPSVWNSSTDLIFNYRNNTSHTSMFFDYGAWKQANNILYQPTFAAGIPLDGDGNGIDFYGKVENYTANYTQTINIPLSGKNGSAIELNPINGDLIFNNQIFNDNNVNFNVYGNNGKKLTLNGYPVGNGSVGFYLKQYSIVEVNFNNAASLSGGYFIENGELWINSNAIIQGNIQVGNGTANYNKVYISNTSTATTVANNITVPTNSPNATIGALNTSAAHVYSGNINLNNNDVYFDEVSAGGVVNFTGTISGSGGIRKISAGLIQLSAVNSYTGKTAINQGTLQLGIANAIGGSSNVVFNAGILSTGAGSGYSDTVGTIALTDNSTIALGSGAHALHFAASNAVAWTPTKTLTITGWANDCVSGKIFVGNSNIGLTAGQLAQVTFSGFPAGAKITAFGELIPNNVLLTATGGTLTGSYPTMKATFDAINLGTHTGIITIAVLGDTTEAATAVLNNNAAVTSVLIQPGGCGARTITGNLALPLIDFNGADFVTIDGINSGGSSLTISNMSTSNTSGTCTIRFQTDATNNVITNCDILGSSTMGVGSNGGNIWFGSNSTIAGNDNNIISYCNIGPAGGNLPTRGVYFSGTTTPGKENSSITITNNNIYDYFSGTVFSAGVEVNTGSTDITISNNHFYQTMPRTGISGALIHYVIKISNASGGGYIVTGNTIGYSNSSGTGTYSITAAAANPTLSLQLIYMATGTTNPSSVQGNTIAGISETTPSTTTGIIIFAGIYSPSGYVNIGNITGNFIGLAGAPINITATGGISTNIYGIFCDSAAAATINVQNNTVQALLMGGAATSIFNFSGVYLAGTASYNVTNNTIGNSVLGDSISIGTLGVTTAACSAKGIYINGTGSFTIGALGLPNTIQNISLNAAATNTFYGIATNTIAGNPSMAINYNSIKGIRFTSATATASLFYGIYNNATADAVTLSNNNLGVAGNDLVTYTAACSGGVYGINNAAGAATAALTIAGNDFIGVTHNVTSSSGHTFILNSSGMTSHNISNNTFTNLSINSTGNVTFINDNVALAGAGTKNINSNSIVGTFAKTSATGTVICYNDSAAASTITGVNNLNNNFSNITVTGANTITGWLNNEASNVSKIITGNIFTNWTADTGNITAMDVGGFGGNSSVSNNTITNINSSNAITGINLKNTGTATTLDVANNSITRLTAIGTGNIIGINNLQPVTTLTCNTTGNTISNFTTATGSITGIAETSLCPTKLISTNTISNLTCPSALLYGMNVRGAAVSITNNTVATLSSGFNGAATGIYTNLISTSAAITGNTVSGITATNVGSNALIRGIEAASPVPTNISNNVVTNLSAASTNITVNPIVGILFSSTNAASTINNNTISNLNATTASANNIAISGIYISSASSGGMTAKNKIYGLTNTSTGASNKTAGYTLIGGNWTVANNMISITNNNTVQTLGIYDLGGNGARNYYYNSIYIGGNHAGTQVSNAFQFNSVTGTADVRNNIFVMNRSSGAKNYAIANLGGSFTGFTADYNVLNCSVASTIGTNGSDQNFASWKTISGGDNNSFSNILVPFTDVTTADLHLTAGCTDIESGGTPLSITDDYDGTIRNATTPDIGADEYTGTQPADIVLTPNSPLCIGSSINLTATSTDLTYVYTWSPPTGLSATTGSSVTANPIVTTTYTVVGTSPSTCTKTKYVTITVNPLPTVITVVPNSVTACINTIQAFTASPVSTSTITVGTPSGTSVAANTPYRQAITTSESRVQYLITKAELNAAGLIIAGKIISLGFKVTTVGSGAMPNYTISMAQTVATSLTTTYIATGFTTVYTTTNLTPVLGMNTHTFATPFAWDGTSNIVINICHNGPGGVASTVAISTFATPRTTAAIATGQCSIATGLTNLNRPVITLGCENPITWTPITELYTDALATVPYVSNTHYTTVYAKPSIPRVYTATATAPGTGCNVTATGTFASAISVWDGLSWTPGTPTGNTSLQFAGDFTSSADLSGCSCTVTSGHVIFNNPATLTLTNGLTVGAGPAATLTFNNNASLVQTNDTATNSGVITMERITQPVYRFDYTYWGSPVTLASNFTLGNLSPNTQPDKYYSWIPTISNDFGTWAQESAATVMDPIKGYIVRAPNSFSSNPGIKAPYTANFIGMPNNGIISTPIYHGTQPAPDYNDDYNLLGNPYPSALDAEKFLSLAANVPVLDGTIYFWTHNSPISISNPDPFYGDFIYNYTMNDYASWNKLGGAGTTSPASSGGATPTGFIAAGQAFFTKSAGAATGSMATFNNSMRVAGNNNQFFRMTNEPLDSNTDSTAFEKHRIWLNLISTSGTFNQILIGYAEGATLGWDRDFDGVRFTETNATTLYSVLPNKDLVIQGRPLPFSHEDQVALGYKSIAADTFSFRIDHFDELFQNQNIYIEDKLLHIIHDLKGSPYVFTSAMGTFNDRFVLRFNDPLLQTNSFDNNPSLIAFINDHQVYVESSQNIQSIQIYDLSGKWIQTYTPQQKRTFKNPFNFPNGMYLAKIKLESGIILTRKLAN